MGVKKCVTRVTAECLKWYILPPIDDKADSDEEIIKKIEEATKPRFQVGQVFESAEECKRTIKDFAKPLGFVA